MPYIKQKDADNVRRQICSLYNSNGDWKHLADTLGIKKSTAYRWVKHPDAGPMQRGGKRREKIRENHREYIARCIEENPRLTLKELKRKFQEEHEMNVSTECLRKHLDGLMYTLKDIRREPERANSEDNKIRRRDYVQQLLNYQADNMAILYMDETNFNLFISRKQGRSLKGTRCRHISAGSRGANIHVIGCIGNLGLIYHQIRRGSFQKPQANEFLRNCLRAAREMYQTPVVLVADNAPCHADFERIFREEEFNDNHLLRLSPYSPSINPIELAWSSLKAAVKRNLAIQLPHILAGEGRVNLTQTEFRLREMENIINNNINTINANICARNIAHIQRYIPDALNMIDIPF